tara:strand:+ start:241 stop:543 length:303 start_codon:yes stop_codon:yes gene_type:complete
MKDMLEAMIGQGAQIWMTKMSRQRNFYVNSFFRDLNQFAQQGIDIQQMMKQPAGQDFTQLMSALKTPNASVPVDDRVNSLIAKQSATDAKLDKILDLIQP